MMRRVAADGMTRAAIVVLGAAVAVLVAVPAGAAVPPAPEPRLVAGGGVDDA